MLSTCPGIDVNKIVQICAIDFESYGFAACFCLPTTPNHPYIVHNWAERKAAADLNKNLTALLIDKTKNNETVAFGYKAEEKYAQAMEKGEDHKYMYFEHFKPLLDSLVKHLLPSSYIIIHPTPSS